MIKVGFVTCVQLGYSCMQAIYEVGGKLDLAITLLDSQAKPSQEEFIWIPFARRTRSLC